MYSIDNEIIKILDESNHTIVSSLINAESSRQETFVELIASENFPSEAIRAACASSLMNKYTEGYPTDRYSGREGRYYGGCKIIDTLEEYCCNKWREVFNTDYHVNVQPHSGSQANLAAYMAILKPGDKVLSMSLNNGSHLTHGSPVNFSGKIYNFEFYGLNKYGLIDYGDIEKKIGLYEPALVVMGASAYSRIIDFQQVRDIIENLYNSKLISKKPYLMVDMAHIAGLVAAGEHPTPFGVADIITSTTQKTLRGPRGGLIFCTNDLARKIDGAVFPGTQGGASQNIIAAKAICAEEALRPSFKHYIKNVIHNTAAMCDEFKKLGYEIVTNGTDNHLFLIDFSNTHPHLTGKAVQEELDKYGITLNKNCVPDEKRSPTLTSGVRIGAAAMTTKGWVELNFREMVREIDKIIKKL